MRRIANLSVAGLSLCLVCSAQEVRGTITGQITDVSGSGIPKAAVIATNMDTNVATATMSNDDGIYTLSFLLHGRYSVSVESQGFNRVLRKDIAVQVGDRLTIDFKLEIGDVKAAVEVTASSAPVLEDSSGSMGEVVDRRRITELPLIDGNPMLLTYTAAAGVVYTGDGMTLTRPFDNDNSSRLVANGAPDYANEYTLDGAPNSATKTKVGFIPPTSAVEEFKIDTLTYDAQKARAGVSVNLVMRTGTNKLHGTVSENYRPDALLAQNFFAKRSGQQGENFQYHRYDASLGGPIRIPKLYDGRDKTFFFLAYEGIRHDRPRPGFRTVPTELQRKGDFSALLAQNIVIFDPFSAQQPAGATQVQRTPLPGNIVPTDRINTVAKNVVSYFPLPNVQGNALGQNNFFTQDLLNERFNSGVATISQILSNRHRMNFRLNYNFRLQDYPGWTGEVNGIRPAVLAQDRTTGGINYEHTYTVSSSTLLTARAGVSHYDDSRNPAAFGFDLHKLGFPESTIAKFRGATYFPQITLERYNDLGTNGEDAFRESNDTIYFAAILAKVVGRHSTKAGYDFKSYRVNRYAYGAPAGEYSFNSVYTRAASNSPSATIGQDLAGMLFGLPQPASNFLIETPRSNQSVLHSLFFHDDFRASTRLTLNLGVRWDFEVPTTERYNRNIRGFDPLAPNPIAASAKAAYASKPDPALGPEAFQVRGGILFANERNRQFWNPVWDAIQPVAGFALRLSKKSVLRGGWRLNWSPRIMEGVQQYGFSQTTNIVVTPDDGLTFPYNLSNPVGVVIEPVGAAIGFAARLGQNMSYLPLDRKYPRFHQFSAEYQRELPGAWVVRAAYTGSRGTNIKVDGENLNALPREYRSTSAWRDEDMNTRNSFLTQQVTNPFRGLTPGGAINGTTISRRQLLLPYPQFLSPMTFETYGGRARYDSFQFRVDKRFSANVSFAASYTFSVNHQWVDRLNEIDTELQKRISNNDRPHRFTMNGIWRLPVGQRQRWNPARRNDVLGKVSGWALGGWQLGSIFLWQPGGPLALGNIYFNGDLGSLEAHYGADVLGKQIFDTSGFYFHDAAVQTNGVDDPVKQRTDPRIQLVNNIRTLPTRITNLRENNIINMDLSMGKRILVGERNEFQLRAEVVNVWNRIQFANPEMNPQSANFGRITSSTQQSIPRQIQFGIRYQF